MVMFSMVYRLLHTLVFFTQNLFILLFAAFGVLFDGLSHICAGYRVMGPLEWNMYTYLDIQKIQLNGLIHSEDDDQEMVFTPEESGDDDQCQSA